MLAYKIWDKNEEINGCDAEYIPKKQQVHTPLSHSNRNVNFSRSLKFFSRVSVIKLFPRPASMEESTISNVLVTAVIKK